MTMRNPLKSAKIAKPAKGKKPMASDGRVYQAGGALKGSKSQGSGMSVAKEGRTSGIRTGGKRGF